MAIMSKMLTSLNKRTRMRNKTKESYNGSKKYSPNNWANKKKKNFFGTPCICSTENKLFLS